MSLYQTLSLLGIPSLITSFGVFIVTILKSKRMKYKIIEDGLICILHNMVYNQGKEYIRVGDITVEDMKDYEYLYNTYHSLGGNGTGTEIYERVKDLPIRQERR